MEFYYKKSIELLKPKCPPGSYRAIDRMSYRWVFDTMEDQRNFIAQAEKNPKMVNGKNDLEVCEGFALSFHISAKSSKEHFNHLVNKSPMAYKRLGTNISEGKLELMDGIAGTTEMSGHFNFHHVKNNNFAEKFKIIEKL